MTSLGLNIGLKSLLTAQASLETIGHNISNASTPGYSRQSLQVSAAPSLRLAGLVQGTGIRADVIQRTVDSLLRGRIVMQTSSLGRIDARLDGMSQAESFLGGASDTGMNVLMQKFFAGMSTLSTAPEDSALKSGAVQSAVELASRFRELASDGDALRGDTLQRIEQQVEQVNALADEVGQLNRQITSSEAGVSTSNDLRDRRDEVLRSLAQLVDARVVEDARGAVRVLVAGKMLVSPSTVQHMTLESDPSSGAVAIAIEGSAGAVDVRGGAIGGLLDVAQNFLPKLAQDLDSFARQWILETNRVHSTGIPSGGPHRSLVAANALVDQDGDGDVTGELLANARLPFDVASGELRVNVTNQATGALESHVIAIDASHTTVAQFLAALNAIPEISARLDAQSHLQISADAGFGFDFSARVDPNPDPIGSFGGGRASLGSSSAEPFALSTGDTLDLVGPLGAFTVTLPAGSIQRAGQATAAELALAINADPNVQANGLVASAVGGELVLQTAGAGASETFTVAGGSALGALGWSSGTVVAGSDHSVAVAVSGSFTGAANGALTFRPNMDGTIGTTPGLKVQVLDASGALVSELDVGAGYAPGDPLEIAPGVEARFSFGELSLTDNDAFRLDLVADSDTSDVLPALGLNVLFTGHDAATIAVRSDIEDNPSLLATSGSGAPGDATSLTKLLQLESRDVEGLGNVSFGERYGAISGQVGLEIDSTTNARDAEQFLLDSLQSRREQVSGVNVDEEMVHMIEQEQAYQAATQFINVINQLNDELLRLL